MCRSKYTSGDLRTNVLTALHKTTTLLPRILPSGKSNRDGVSERESLPFWEEVLRKVYDDLTLAPEKREKDKVRVVVYGVDGTSGAYELVTALLEDPFVSNEQRTALRSRWDSQPEGSGVVKIQYGTSPSEDEGVVHVQSSWLKRFGVPIEVTECNSPSTEGSKALINADVPIIVCNPVLTPLPALTSLDSFSTPPFPIFPQNTIFAVISPSSSKVFTEPFDSQCVLTGFRVEEGLRFLHVDPARALHGLDVLADGSASTLSVQRYQDDATGSNVTSVTKAVTATLSSSSSGSVAAVHAQTGRALIKYALTAAYVVLDNAQAEADGVLRATSELRSEMEEAKAKAHLEVFGAGGKDGDEIAKAVAQAKRNVQPTMDALQWYKLFWRVDDVREAVAAAVDRAWCRDLERKLVFHAGRLASLQASFTQSANTLARSFPASAPYHSPVLLNSLARIASSPSYALTPAALTAPLHARQAQLGFPTSRLHASAQRAVLGMSGSVLGGLGVAWAGWATELQLLGGMIDVGMGPETAVGVGMLGAAIGVRWAVGRWERAKRRWWKDWDRVGDGLERDLKAALAETMDSRVVAVSEEACSGLDDLVAQRKSRIEELNDEVMALWTELHRE
ncbi:hypothetical protein GSI_01527 [Ganoderma sinense ZZ0214-1]|uniref:Mmc1 C-terminal domain-containing protein n=1 Tax=Ganoderma sinense ZZ0214-1 TaxID=1077348 RepID=A0A2G8SQ15_9APHY|nr:hypothetical protein GSI_01527 [Ganoderma sinense ZZ0214-1]